MSLIVESFTAADATNITSLSGWNLHPFNADPAFVYSNRLTKDVGIGQHLSYHSTNVIGDASIEILLAMMTAIAVNAGIAISMDPVNDDYVYARHNQSNGEWSLRSVVSSVVTVLGTATETLVGGDSRTMRLERRTMAGPHDEYRLLVAGSQIIPWTRSDGHSGTKVGLRFAGAASSTTGYAIDNVTVDVVPALQAPLGMFDPELRAEAWFDPDLVSVGWFDREIIDVPAILPPSTFPVHLHAGD